MEKGARDFIKKCGFKEENITFIDEPIMKTWEYNKLYKPSKGSYSGDGYCLFLRSSTSLPNKTTGTIHVFPVEVEEKVFKLGNMPVGVDE